MVLSNGARFYVDHAHPEYSSPECADPHQAALYDKAGERVVAAATGALRRTLRPGENLYVHKNNSDGKGNSYGYHENYLVSRTMPFADLIHYATTWLGTRQIFTGSGKLGSENGRPDVAYQLSQRADFFEEEVGLETTLKRPIVNTRDEPHGDPTKYRRFHVIIGDANMSEVQTFLKLGATALMLSAIEDRAIPETLALADPVEATWRLSHDLSLSLPLPLADGVHRHRPGAADRLPRMAFQICRTGSPRTAVGRCDTGVGRRATGSGGRLPPHGRSARLVGEATHAERVPEARRP